MAAPINPQQVRLPAHEEIYRDYRIELGPWYFAWQMRVDPTKSELPKLSRSEFRWAGVKREAMMEARGRVDDLLG